MDSQHLSVSSVNWEGQERKFDLYMADLNQCFDILNLVVALGDKVLSAEIRDEQDGIIRLPIAAFDGTPISSQLVLLETELQTLLNKYP
jgi:hypothetical protein